MVKRKNEDANVASAKAGKVECEFCGKSYTVRGLTRHQNSCSRRLIKRREFCFESTNVNAFAHILSFLSNQSVVKLQAATGAIYAGSNAVLSAVCCPCEKDELTIADGLCLACNRVKAPWFRGTITSIDAKKLYGVHDIDNMTHSTSRTYRRYCLYKDLEHKAIETFGSKKKWLEHIAPKLLRRQKIEQAKRRAEEEYRALLATFSKEFQTFVRFFSEDRMTEEQLRERAARLDSVCEKLTARSLDVDGYFTHTSAFVLKNVGTAEEVADSIEQTIKEKERRKQDLEALGARDLELSSDSGLCYDYISKGKGAVNDIVDTKEELKFLYAHTSENLSLVQPLAKRQLNDPK
eukprot:jgi/Phyca11/14841/fgenesh1_pg.PHYCAscaffold_9_\